MKKKQVNITVFRDLKEDNFISMEIYADNLIDNLPKNIRVRQYVQKLPKVKIFLKYIRFIAKHFIYPVNANKHQSEINHVIDHSYGHLVNYLDRNRTIITCNDLNSLEYPRTTNFIGRQMFKYYLKGMVKAKRIIAISQHTKDDILKYMNYPEKQICVVYDGYDDKLFKPLNIKAKISFKKKHNLDKYKILLSVGSQPYKNTLLILQALCKLRTKIKNILLIKVGNFSKEEILFIKKRKLQKNIKTFKNISSKELVYIYNVSDILVFPSFHEGFGLPPLEAMACGCPVIASNTSSLPEVVSDAGILINPKSVFQLEQAIFKVLCNTGIKNSMIQKGLKRAKLFSWKNCAKETARIYKEVLGSVRN